MTVGVCYGLGWEPHLQALPGGATARGRPPCGAPYDGALRHRGLGRPVATAAPPLPVRGAQSASARALRRSVPIVAVVRLRQCAEGVRAQGETRGTARQRRALPVALWTPAVGRVRVTVLVSSGSLAARSS